MWSNEKEFKFIKNILVKQSFLKYMLQTNIWEYFKLQCQKLKQGPPVQVKEAELGDRKGSTSHLQKLAFEIYACPIENANLQAITIFPMIYIWTNFLRTQTFHLFHTMRGTTHHHFWFKLTDKSSTVLFFGSSQIVKLFKLWQNVCYSWKFKHWLENLD